MQIISGIVALIKAIPIIDSWFKKLIDVYVNSQIDKINERVITNKEQYRAIYNAIKKAETNEERNALSVALAKFK